MKNFSFFILYKLLHQKIKQFFGCIGDECGVVGFQFGARTESPGGADGFCSGIDARLHVYA